MSITAKSQEILDQLIKWRRDLHKNPEVELNLPKTAAYIKNELEKLGIPYETYVNEMGIVGLIEGKGGAQNKTIALRADTDALPIEEKTGAEYASQNGYMHACGHDVHAAILLAVGKILNDMKDELPGNVKLIFQPAEEKPGGAKPMIDEGVLENPKVDAIMGLHVGNIIKGLEYGKVAVKSGPAMAASDIIKLDIKGSGCHGSAPHTGVDPIVVTSHVVTSLQNMINRETKPTDPVVLSFGRMCGGETFNAIPEQIELEGIVRTFSNETREYVSNRYKEIVESVTKGFRADYYLDYFFSYPPLINDEQFTETFIESAQKVIDEDEIYVLKEPVMGSEDMAYFLQEVPGTFFFLGTDNPEKGITYPNHNAKFDVDEDVLWRGPALLVQTTLDWLNQGR